MSLLDHLTEMTLKAALDPKTAMAVGTGTIWLANWLDKIPEDLLAKAATLLGMCLTVLLIVVHGVKLKRMLWPKQRNGTPPPQE